MSRKRIDGRLSYVEQLLASGVSGPETPRRAAEKFSVGLRQGQTYVQRVFARWATQESEQRHDRKIQFRKMTEALYRECMLSKQPGPALRALVILGRLDGLFEHPPSENVFQASPKSLSPKERRERIRVLIVQAIKSRPELAIAAREALDSLPA
ncbi:MAG: hypothetical protein GY811_04045 [Myxococcales bacterium]|nr:hypothetical protein [Myxococcales bacterium]